MAEFTNILFPIDFSPACENVAPHVVAMAKRYRSRVTALSVLDIPTARYLGFETSCVWSLAEIDQIRDEHRKSLHAFENAFRILMSALKRARERPRVSLPRRQKRTEAIS